MASKVLTLVNGIVTEVSLCCNPVFIILQEHGGDDIAINPAVVEAVTKKSATQSRVHTSNVGIFTVAGDVATVTATLTV